MQGKATLGAYCWDSGCSLCLADQLHLKKTKFSLYIFVVICGQSVLVRLFKVDFTHQGFVCAAKGDPQKSQVCTISDTSKQVTSDVKSSIWSSVDILRPWQYCLGEGCGVAARCGSVYLCDIKNLPFIFSYKETKRSIPTPEMLSQPFLCIVLCRSLSQQQLQELYIFLGKRCMLRFAHNASVNL